tara:strand:+ start:97 stop:579 length:483 start_codon:yes stop_codon:yes gene_type:complete
MSSKIKKFNESAYNSKMKELEIVATLLQESEVLCIKIANVKTLAETEHFLNEKSGFVNASMSAAAYGHEVDYKRLLDIEKMTKGLLDRDTMTANWTFKKPFLAQVKDEFTEYFTDAEADAILILDTIAKKYNELDIRYRASMGINREHKLQYFPNNTLLR